jgi:hypothetical protein
MTFNVWSVYLLLGNVVENSNIKEIFVIVFSSTVIWLIIWLRLIALKWKKIYTKHRVSESNAEFWHYLCKTPSSSSAIKKAKVNGSLCLGTMSWRRVRREEANLHRKYQKPDSSLVTDELWETSGGHKNSCVLCTVILLTGTFFL